MRDVVKSQYNTKQPVPQQPRRRRRKRNLTLYYLMIFILVSIVGVVLSLTVFFKISKVNIIGTTLYDPNDIISASNIKVGDNIFREDYDKAKEKILKGLIYIDDVEIKRTLTCQVNISVEPSVPYADIAYDNEYLLISQTGKILEKSSAPKDGILVFNGYEPDEIDIGEKITSEDSNKDSLLKSLCDKLDKLEIKQITSIDITDRYNIIMVYANRITIQLGGSSDLEYKINYANELIESNKISKTKEGTLFMRGNNEASFVEKKDLEKYEQNYQSATVSQGTTTGSETSDTKVTTAAQN